MENEKLDITPTVGLLALLKNMRYTEWYALGEFVDNSIQSYNSLRHITKLCRHFANTDVSNYE